MAGGRAELNSHGGATATAEYQTVYVDTNLDTHLVMLVSNSDTISDFKEKIVVEHREFFPKIRCMLINSIKVKREMKLYHVPDAMLVWRAFDGVEGNWVVSVDASSTGTCRDVNSVCTIPMSLPNSGMKKAKAKKKKKKVTRKNMEKSGTEQSYVAAREKDLEDKAQSSSGYRTEFPIIGKDNREQKPENDGEKINFKQAGQTTSDIATPADLKAGQTASQTASQTTSGIATPTATPADLETDQATSQTTSNIATATPADLKAGQTMSYVATPTATPADLKAGQTMSDIATPTATPANLKEPRQSTKEMKTMKEQKKKSSPFVSMPFESSLQKRKNIQSKTKNPEEVLGKRGDKRSQSGRILINKSLLSRPVFRDSSSGSSTGKNESTHSSGKNEGTHSSGKNESKHSSVSSSSSSSSDSSTTSDDSDGPTNAQGKYGDGEKELEYFRSHNITMEMILRSSEGYKKALAAAKMNEEADEVEFGPDS